MNWVRWTVPGWLEHPFLTDTVLWISTEGIVWIHPTEADKYSHPDEIHHAIHDVLFPEKASRRSDQASPEKPATTGRNNSGATVAGDGPRKRPRVEEEQSSTLRDVERSGSPTRATPGPIGAYGG